jgi:hypothetical protein
MIGVLGRFFVENCLELFPTKDVFPPLETKEFTRGCGKFLISAILLLLAIPRPE